MRVEEAAVVTEMFRIIRPRGIVIEIGQENSRAKGKRLFCGDCNGGIFSFMSPPWHIPQFIAQCVNCKAVYPLDSRVWCFF